MSNARLGFTCAFVAAIFGCAAPGEEAERAAAEREGAPYRHRFGKRTLPVLPAFPSLEDTLQYAFLSNPAVEAAYFEWRMSLERVPQAGALDDPRLNFEYLFSKQQMSRWDRTTLGVSQMIPFPGKLETARKAALDMAIAARRRFEDAKFMLQAEVVEAWAELRFIDVAVEVARDNLALLRDFASTTLALLSTGKAGQADVSKADLEVSAAENELKAREAERPPALAKLNALLSRPPAVPLKPTSTAGANPPLPAQDDAILSLAADRNRELQAMAAEVKGRENALDLAWKAYLPDFQIGLDIRGSMERMLMGMLTLPIQLGRIRAGIDEAGAAVRATEARLRARKDGLGAQVVLNLYLARDAARQADLFRDSLIPRAKEVVDATKESYKTGGASYLMFLDAQRMLLELRLGRARMEAMRDRATARLEALAALDFGTLGGQR